MKIKPIIFSTGFPGSCRVFMKRSSFTDAIIGVIGHLSVGDKGRWVVPYYLDVGTGDSDLTWQAMAGLGYQFDWGAMIFTYRYLDYDSGSGSPVTDLTIAGPMLGASFQW